MRNKDNLVGFAVVGCGKIGTRHLAVLDANPRTKIMAVCDIDAEIAHRLSALYNNAPFFTNFTKMISQTEADVVNICTPHSLHAQMAIEAIRVGKHALVEKPMALTVAGCKEMIAEAQYRNMRLMVVKQNRYNVPVMLTKKALDAQALGRIYMVQCNVLWNRSEGYYQNSPWRGQRKLEGGALYTQVSHFLDLMIWWFGDVLTARTMIATRNHSIEIDDCGLSLLTFSSGAMGSLSWTTCVLNKNYEGSITIIGERGIVRIGGEYLNKIEKWDIESYPLPEGVEFIDTPNNYTNYQGTSSNHDKVISEVVSDLLTGQRNVVDGEAGLKTIQAIELIYRDSPLQRYDRC